MTAKMPTRFVRELKNGRLQIEIDKRITREDGKRERARIRRLLPAGTTMREAESIAAKLAHGITVKAAAVATTNGWHEYVSRLSDSPGSWIYATLKNARHRAKERGFECSLTADQIRAVLLRSGGRCEVTGLRFTHEREDGQRTRPYFHSLDRIRSSDGYTIDNVRAVCHAANIAMNTWGEQVFAELARGFVFNRYSAFYAG